MKTQRTLLALTCTGIFLMGCSANNLNRYEVVSGEPDFSPKAGDNVLRIGAWVAPPSGNWNNKGNPNFITQERYDEIEESGINVIYGLYEIANRPAIASALGYAEKSGIEYLARDNLDLDPQELELEEGDLHAITKSYDSASALKGWLVTDEPGARKFERLARLKELFQKDYPGKEFYVNLFPTYANTSQLQASSYEEYIDEYISTVHPDFVSFDHYSMMEDGYGNKKLTDDVLYNLEIVANKCKQAGIPMYTFVQAMSYDNATRVPNEAEVRHQVMTELAYGSRSIQYFCYWTPLEFTDAGSPSMITKDGKRTALYDHVKAVNAELKNLDEAYLDFSWVGAMPVKGSNVEGEVTQMQMCSLSLKEIEAISDLACSENTLIGAFKNKEGRDGFLISNFSDPSLLKKDVVSLRFNGADAALVYHGQSKEVVELSSSSFEITLDEGDGIFVIPFKK